MLPLRNPESAQVDVVALTLSALGFKRKTVLSETASGSFQFASGSQHKVAECRLRLLAPQNTEGTGAVFHGLRPSCSLSPGSTRAEFVLPAPGSVDLQMSARVAWGGGWCVHEWVCVVSPKPQE